MTAPARSLVVVGVDGSTGSRDAVRWAAGYARLAGAELTAVDATLLVVGARGRAAFAGMLLGSVAEYCVRNGPCPVVVVRTPVSQAPGEGKG
jgi:nucleotide-binding universal stress UspA family protein